MISVQDIELADSFVDQTRVLVRWEQGHVLLLMLVDIHSQGGGGLLALRHPLAESHARGAVDGESKGCMPVCASDKVST